MTPYERLELHPPDDDRIPHHPPSRPRRVGCSVFALVVAVVVLVGLEAAGVR